MSKKNIRKANAGRKVKSPASHVTNVGNRLEQTLSRLSSLVERLHADSEAHNRNSEAPDGRLVPLTQLLEAIKAALLEVEPILREFQIKIQVEPALSGQERRRLIGVRSRNLGFITKAWDLSNENQDFWPPHLSMAGMRDSVAVMEQARLLTVLLNHFHQVVDDILLTHCDQAYRDALVIYGHWRELSRVRVPGANALFQELRQFFMLRRRNRNASHGNGEPSVKEIERDVKRLLHGKADGRVVIEHESLKTSGGVCEVVDEVSRE